MNWRAGGFALLGSVAGAAVGVVAGKVLAPTLHQHDHDGHKYAGSALLVGASIGAIIGLAIATEDSATVTLPPPPAGGQNRTTQ